MAQKEIKILSSKAKVQKSIFDKTSDYTNNAEEVSDKTLKIFRGLTANLEDDIKNLTAKERVELSIKLMPNLVRLQEQVNANANLTDDEKAIKGLFKVDD